MRVGLVSSLAEGGPVEHTVTLARGLAGMGAEVDAVCATPEVAERLDAAGARAYVVPLRHSLDARAARLVRRRLAGRDVCHAQDRRSGLWLRLLPPPNRRAVRVYTVHGLPEPYLPHTGVAPRPGARAMLAYRGLDAGLARRADAIVTPSRAMEKMLVRQLGWPAARITVIPNGVELGEPLQRCGTSVGSLSAFVPVKGLDVFLAAAAQLAERRPDLRFLLFGDGPDAGALLEHSVQLGLGDRVAFPGWVPTRAGLAQLAVLVLPSHMENAPLALLDAMAAGVPIVATRVGGVPELAPPGTARLVNPGDADALARAIERVLERRSETAAQIAAARRHVERHGGADAMAGRTLALYRRLLEARA